MVNIENTNPADNLKQPEVFDMNGRLVKTYAVRQGINIQLYFDDIAQGVYYVRLRADSGKQVISKITILE